MAFGPIKKPINAGAANFLHPLTPQNTSNAKTDRGATEPTREGIQISYDRTKSHHRCDIQQRRWKQNETAHYIDCQNPEKHPRIILDRLLPADNRFEIDDFSEGSQPPCERYSQEQEKTGEKFEQGCFTFTGWTSPRHVWPRTFTIDTGYILN